MDSFPNKDLGISERISTSRGRSGRTQTVGGRFTLAEEQEIQNAARADGKLVSEWTRDALLHQARRERMEAATLTELVALRMLLNNVLRPIALGQQVTPDAYSKILTEVRTGKHDAAREVLAQYAATGRKEQ